MPAEVRITYSNSNLPLGSFLGRVFFDLLESSTLATVSEAIGFVKVLNCFGILLGFFKRLVLLISRSINISCPMTGSFSSSLFLGFLPPLDFLIGFTNTTLFMPTFSVFCNSLIFIDLSLSAFAIPLDLIAGVMNTVFLFTVLFNIFFLSDLTDVWNVFVVDTF